MTEHELQRLIEDELGLVAPAGSVEFAADVARLAAVGLVEIARTPSGDLRIAPLDEEP